MLVLTAGVDVQDDRFEVEVVGWGVDKESWGIKYQAIYGDLKLKPVWDELDKFLSQTFTTADGRRLKIICACVDSGGHFTTQVYRFCKEQSYTIGSRSLTKADLADIRQQIEFWKNEVARLENIEKRGGRNRVFRVVPRDL